MYADMHGYMKERLFGYTLLYMVRSRGRQIERSRLEIMGSRYRLVHLLSIGLGHIIHWLAY